MEERYDDIYGDEQDVEIDVNGTCPFCDAMNSMSLGEDNYLTCTACDQRLPIEVYRDWLRGVAGKDLISEFDIRYEPVYDTEGNSVPCDCCDYYLKYKDGEYVCPNCGRTLTREDFLNYIGA